ncbi:MAG: ABC transporter ATP-binding protein [Vicinamibacterales bacterium]
MLEARGLGKYYSGIPAVKNVNFTLARGGVLGLLGPNGSGKSTTVSMVTSLLEPTTGQILLDGQSISRAPLEYKARIGYVPEEAHLYTYLTGPEYLELVGQLRGVSQRVLAEKISSFMRIFGLEDDRYAPMSAYSKGMRQKILIAAALLHDPDVVILDEPNSGLDVTSTLVLRSLVQQLGAGRQDGALQLARAGDGGECRDRCDDPARLERGRARFSVTPARAHGPAVSRTGFQESGPRGGRRPGCR